MLLARAHEFGPYAPFSFHITFFVAMLCSSTTDVASQSSSATTFDPYHHLPTDDEANIWIRLITIATSISDAKRAPYVGYRTDAPDSSVI